MLPSLHHEGFYVAHTLNLLNAILDFLQFILFFFRDEDVGNQSFQAVGDRFFLKSENFGILWNDGLDLLL